MRHDKKMGGYLVLSIGDLRELTRKAREQSKQTYNGKVMRQSTLVCDCTVYPDSRASDGRVQVSHLQTRD